MAVALLLLGLCSLLVWALLRRRRSYPHTGPVAFQGFEAFPVVRHLGLTHAPPAAAAKTKNTSERAGAACRADPPG